MVCSGPKASGTGAAWYGLNQPDQQGNSLTGKRLCRRILSP